MAAQMRALPESEFPALVQLADDLTADDAEAIFDFGVRLVLRGLEALR